MTLKDWISLLVTVGSPIIAFYIGYVRLQAKFEAHEKEDAREMAELRKAYDGLDGKLTRLTAELFMRVTENEKFIAAQGEINKNLAALSEKMDRRLENMESILQQILTRGK